MIQATLPLRSLGQSSITISAIGLGCWQFSEGRGLGGYWPALEQNEVEEIIKLCIESGINWFDTAEIYGNGKSEEALSAALNALGDKASDILIATKWWPLFRRANSITQTIEQRLTCLQGRKIDLYQVHQPFSFSSVEAEMKEMVKLVESEKIRTIGVSNFNEEKMRKAYQVLKKQGIPLVSNQVKYSLLDRRIEKNGVMKAAKELGITIIAYSPLEQGILSGKFHKDPNLIKKSSGPRKYMPAFKEAGLKKSQPLITLLEKMALEYNVSPTQIALNWLIHFHGETVVAIPGATKTQHAKENAGVLTFQLSDSHLHEIDKVSKEVARF